MPVFRAGTPEDRGVNYRALEELFRVKDATDGKTESLLTLSVLEIYNETVRDLLADTGLAPSSGLEIGQNKRGETVVRGLSEWPVATMDDVVRGMDLASSHRAVGA